MIALTQAGWNEVGVCASREEAQYIITLARSTTSTHVTVLLLLLYLITLTHLYARYFLLLVRWDRPVMRCDDVARIHIALELTGCKYIPEKMFKILVEAFGQNHLQATGGIPTK